jgi:hypothetical protein
MSVLPSFVVLLRLCKALPDQVDIPLRRCGASLRFLLKDVQNIDRALEMNRIDRPVGVRPIPLDNFNDPCPAKPFRGFAAGSVKPC